jgi:hypothetical protein
VQSPSNLLPHCISYQTFTGDDLTAICEQLKEGFKGFGTDEDKVLDAMGSLTLEQRCYISLKYKEMYDKDLRDVLKSECGKRNFGKTLEMMSLAPHIMEVSYIKQAGKGLGTDERLLHSIICGRSNRDMEILVSISYRYPETCYSAAIR